MDIISSQVKQAGIRNSQALNVIVTRMGLIDAILTMNL